MRPKIYIIRHGQTDWNAKGRLQGQTDVPMNPFGKTQVVDNAEKLAIAPDNLQHFDFVSSPISRARETMQIVRTTLGLSEEDYRVDDRLKELDYGDFSRHTWDELREARPDDVKNRYANTWNYVIPKGECYAMLSKRVLSWFHEIERDTIVTAHAGVSRVLQGYLKKHPEQDIAFLEAPQDRVLILSDGDVSWL